MEEKITNSCFVFYNDFLLKKCEENPDFAIYSQNYFSCNASLKCYFPYPQFLISLLEKIVSANKKYLVHCFPKKTELFREFTNL